MDREEIMQYLAGLKADGYFDLRNEAYNYAFKIYDKDYEFLTIVAKLIKKYLKLEPRIYPRRNYRWYELAIYSRQVVPELYELWHNLLKEPTTPFVRGLGDAEATIIKDNPNRIKFTNRDLTIVNAFKKVLDELSINYNYYIEKRRNGIDHVVRISGKTNISKYAQSIGFLHPNKRSRLILYWNIHSIPNLDKIL